MKKNIFLFLLISVPFSFLWAQKGKSIRFTSAHTMFPDTARADGHDYNGKHFDAATHYSDSSVYIYVSEHFSSKKKINLVFWFHGWGNNIDSALQQYRLVEQFEASKRNAVFVFPEGPKNASDSYGGKLEQPKVFDELVSDVVEELIRNKILPLKSIKAPGINITLAGHSGAYRVISKIISHANVNEVILFDAMYGGNDEYLQWLSFPEHRFINIYTKDGGTFDNSHFIMTKLSDSLHIPFVSMNEEQVNKKVLRSNNKVFMFSSKAHNEVITHNNNWERFLKYKPN